MSGSVHGLFLFMPQEVMYMNCGSSYSCHIMCVCVCVCVCVRVCSAFLLLLLLFIYFIIYLFFK